jgi:HSP20 family protein
MFTSTLSGFSGSPGAGNRFPVDLYEDKGNTYVRAELPGVGRADVNVEIVEGNLNILASRKEKRGDQEQSFSFSRSIGVPDEVQTDKVSANFENGVLTVTLPKKEEAKPKKVAVTVS